MIVTDEIKIIGETVAFKIIKCDICGKTIRDSKYGRLYTKIQDYYHLTIEHSDWGNDSIENFDICSEECLRKKFYVENENG